MAQDTEKKSETGDYSGTKAGENQPHVESEFQTGDESLIPGGPTGSAAPIGMSGLERDEVPSAAVEPGQTDYGTPAAKDRHRSDREVDADTSRD